MLFRSVRNEARTKRVEFERLSLQTQRGAYVYEQTPGPSSNATDHEMNEIIQPGAFDFNSNRQISSYYWLGIEDGRQLDPRGFARIHENVITARVSLCDNEKCGRELRVEYLECEVCHSANYCNAICRMVSPKHKARCLPELRLLRN